MTGTGTAFCGEAGSAPVGTGLVSGASLKFSEVVTTTTATVIIPSVLFPSCTVPKGLDEDLAVVEADVVLQE